MIAFAGRNAKEILRDKINLFFGLGFPLVLLCLMSLIQANIPVSLFAIEHLAPGIAVFGLSFITLFSATLIAKDRSTAFMLRLFTSPLTAGRFILGYTLPLLPMALCQGVICFAAALLFKLPLSGNLALAILTLIPTSIMYIGIGLLCGTLLNDKQVGGICGALLTNLSAWLSGIWFDVSLVGGVFEAIANALPFIHGVNACRFALAGQYDLIWPELYWVIGYAVVIFIIAAWCFRRKMDADNT